MTNDQDFRIKQLFEAASNALAGGRDAAADRLLRQAEAEAPEHPLVQNQVASRMMHAGNFTGARALLEHALKADPGNASLWINLTAALRSLGPGYADEEMKALEKALEIDPFNVRALLQKGSLHEARAEPRAAAMAYRTALRVIPEGFAPPPQLRAFVEHARDTVAANDRALEVFLEDRLREFRQRYRDMPQDRFDGCLATLLRKRKIYGQQPTFMYFPRLPVIEFHDRSLFPWLDEIEAATDDIRAELLTVMAEDAGSLQPYVAGPDGTAGRFRELNNSLKWSVYHFWREGVPFPEHLARCPRTAKALEAWPKCDVPGSAPSAVFSILQPRTHIPPHSGVSNTRLLVHLPLIVPPGCALRCGAETREWVPGQAFVFDDTIEHEAWNNSDQVRAVMIFDIWSPFLTEAERALVRETTVAVGEYYGIRTYDGD